MPGDISQILIRWHAGDPAALGELTPLVYGELRKLGRAYIRRRPGQSLEPTALVHEAWLRLVPKNDLLLLSRTHFYALAARIMRDLLVDRCRRHRAAKRGGNQIPIALNDADPGEKPKQFDLIMLNDVLCKLSQIKPRYTEIIDLRFFGGLNIEETAEVLGVSSATIEREWNVARSWLRRELGNT